MAMQKRYLTVPRWALAIGSFGYVGFLPLAPGTAASAIAVVLYYFLPPLQQSLVFIAVLLVLMIAGIKAADVIVRTADEADPGFVVCDEVVGQWIALMSPLYQGDLGFILSAFVFFRLFDIFKPFPASYFQGNRRDGIDVMMDDVVAGVYANLLAHAFFWIFSFLRR